MVSGSIPRRYAKALFSLAVETNRVEAWSESLQVLAELVQGSADLRDVLSNPVYSKEQRRAIVERLVAALKLDPEPANLLFLMADRNRLELLDQVVLTFRTLADAQLGRVRAKVTSAVPLEQSSLDAIAAQLSRATSSKVLLDRAVDPALLGGVVTQVGSLVFDGSIRTQLEELRKSLKQ
ncbi:MAG: ATP synthase F1 subunit delta [Anaeromyxobacter sp.]